MDRIRLSARASDSSFSGWLRRFFLISGMGAICGIPGCSPVGKPMRKPVSAGVPAAERAYIESQTAPKFSCSFVEFDGRGDFMDFDGQHQACYGKIEDLAKEKPLLLVIYCHGWKNNSQSADVVRFNEFLAKLAASEEGKRHRVHGVFLGWRGNLLRPYVSKDDSYKKMEQLFGEPIVSSKWQRPMKYPAAITEQFTYWTVKRGAEHKVSGLPITRAIYTYAGTAKNSPATGSRNRVFVIGHSFGALMLEQSLLQGMTGGIMTQWSKSGERGAISDLPFDLVLLVNSAAPSIYAHQMRGFLAGDSGRRRRSGVKDGDAPVIVSLTSRGDHATRIAHHGANLLTPLYPSMQRNYESDSNNRLFVEREENPPKVHQSEFYKRTPGHNPFLVNHWIEPDPGRRPEHSGKDAFGRNLDFSAENPEKFWVRGDSGVQDPWMLVDERPDPLSVRGSFRGFTPRPWRSSYWIVSCPKEIIKDHGDVWSYEAMEVYAALYRIAAVRRSR